MLTFNLYSTGSRLVFLVWFGANSAICVERNHKLVATGLRLGSVFVVRDLWRSCGSGWSPAYHPKLDDAGCSGVQQHPIQLNAAGHDGRFGSATPALALAQSIGNWPGSSSLGGQEWLTHFLDWNAGNAPRSRVSYGKVPSPGRNCFLRDRPDHGLRVALDTEKGRRFVPDIGIEYSEGWDYRRLI